MKIVKRIVIFLVIYAGIITAFESMIGFFQPEAGTTLVIETTAEDGSSSDRVLARLESGGKTYVAANHWPRAWYNQALANPHVRATWDETTQEFLAVPIPAGGAEHERVYQDNNPGMAFRILTGFPPRYFLRLDPRPSTARDLE